MTSMPSRRRRPETQLLLVLTALAAGLTVFFLLAPSAPVVAEPAGLVVP
jgi:hypothetical protein